MKLVKIKSVKKLKKKVRMFDLKVLKNNNFILANGIISHNSGKSWLLRGLNDRVSKNYCCAILTDIKGEMISSLEKIQNQFINLLDENEYPESTPIKSFTPQFLVKYRGKLPAKNTPLKFSLIDLEESDFITLFGIDEKDTLKLNIIKSVFDKIKSRVISSFEELKEFIQGMAIHSTIKRTFLMTLENLIKYEVIGDEFSGDRFIEAIKEGYVPVLNLKGFEDVEQSYPQVYVAILLRKLMRAKRDKIIKKPLFITIDEAPNFAPATGNPTSKQEILKCFSYARQYGISLRLATTDISRVDRRVFRESRYVFMASSLTRENFEYILKQCQLWSNVQDSIYGVWVDEFKDLQKHEWAVLHKERKKLYLIKPTAPLSKHMSEAR